MRKRYGAWGVFPRYAVPAADLLFLGWAFAYGNAMEAYWKRREGKETGQNRYRRAG